MKYKFSFRVAFIALDIIPDLQKSFLDFGSMYDPNFFHFVAVPYLCVVPLLPSVSLRAVRTLVAG